MKVKKIIFLISLFVMIKSVNAETIYGEYYKVESLFNEPLDEIKIDSYKVYNTYKLEYVDLGYLEENNKYIKDENDYIEGLFDTTIDNDSEEYITISTLSLERNTIFFGDIDTNFKVSEIEIYYKNEKIDYEINNEHIYRNIEYIKDDDTNTIFENTRNYNNLVLVLNKYYPSEYLKVIIHTEENTSFNFKIYVDNKIPIKINSSNKHIITFNTDKSDTNALYQYKEFKRLYKYYKNEKNIKNIYVKSGDNILLDDYKIITEYYKRDKLVIDDNLVINKNSTDINSFIKYSSKDVIISDNIDYTKNGTYKCKFILNDIEIEKDVIVALNENSNLINNKSEENILLNEQENTILNKQEDIILDRKDLNNEVKENTETLETTNSINKKIKRNKTNKVNKKVKTTKQIKKETTTKKTTNNIKNLNNSKNTTKDTKITNKFKNINNKKIIKLIILILITIIEIYLIRKKKKK